MLFKLDPNNVLDLNEFYALRVVKPGEEGKGEYELIFTTHRDTTYSVFLPRNQTDVVNLAIKTFTERLQLSYFR